MASLPSGLGFRRQWDAISVLWVDPQRLGRSTQSHSAAVADGRTAPWLGSVAVIRSTPPTHACCMSQS